MAPSLLPNCTPQKRSSSMTRVTGSPTGQDAPEHARASCAANMALPSIVALRVMASTVSRTVNSERHRVLVLCVPTTMGPSLPRRPLARWLGLLTRFGAQRPPSRASDPLARPAQEDRGGLVTRDDYRTGEKAAGISSLLSCRIGRTPVCGGHAPPAWREASRTRARSLRSLYTQVWTNLFSPPSSLVQQAARAENFSRASMALLHPSSTLGMSPGA